MDEQERRSDTARPVHDLRAIAPAGYDLMRTSVSNGPNRLSHGPRRECPRSGHSGLRSQLNRVLVTAG